MLLVVTPSLGGYSFDINSWRAWSKHLLHHGLSKAYGSGSDYPVLYQYVLWLYAKLAGSDENIDAGIAYLRLVTLAADLVSLRLVFVWTKRRTPFRTMVVFTFLNVGFLFNALVWGQVDGILAMLMLATAYTAWKGRPLLSGACMILALNFKLQALVLVPVFLLLQLHQLRRRRWFYGPSLLAAMATVQALVVLPFVQEVASRKGMLRAYFGSVGRYPKLSMNAFNFWYWLFDDPANTSDALRGLGGLSYKHWGLLLFCTASLLAMLPWLRYAWKSTFTRTPSSENVPPGMVWLTCAVIVELFFFCNTQMHERYMFPAFIFLVAWFFASRDIVLYALFSLACFLTHEKVMHTLKLVSHEHWLFAPWFIAGLHAACVLLMLARLYGFRWLLKRDTSAVFLGKRPPPMPPPPAREPQPKERPANNRWVGASRSYTVT